MSNLVLVMFFSFPRQFEYEMNIRNTKTRMSRTKKKKKRYNELQYNELKERSVKDVVFDPR